MFFNEQTVASDDPFIVNARRKPERNKPCWCLSGKKHKLCHRGREKKAVINAGQALQVGNEIFRVKRCMHPSSSECNGRKIRSHTIQRRGGLKHIVDDDNKVLMMRINMEDCSPEKTGWKEASTFYGFCSHHDLATFKGIEGSPFKSSEEQCFLLYYRALCYQSYQKEAFVKTLKRQKETLDNGHTLDEQINIQLNLNRNIHDYGRTVLELNEEKRDADTTLMDKTYSNYAHLIVYFTGHFDLFTTSHFHPAYDLSGNEIYDIYDESVPGEGASFSIVPVNDETSAFVVSWNKKYSHVKTFIERLLNIAPETKLNLMHQLLFAQSENVCFSSNWWDSLGEAQKSFVKKLYAFGGDNYGRELNPELVLHRWVVEKIETINF
tara:strand:+ start:2214 stop:3353 length:1140 start_codon:yes stop_codon:yes gene_type:complete